MKYLFQLIGIIIVFIIFVIGYLAQFLWKLEKPTVTYEATLEICKEFGKVDGYD
jgi:uncharacterized protein YpmB